MCIRDSMVCPAGADENRYPSPKKLDAIPPPLTGPRNVELPLNGKPLS